MLDKKTTLPDSSLSNWIYSAIASPWTYETFHFLVFLRSCSRRFEKQKTDHLLTVRFLFNFPNQHNISRYTFFYVLLNIKYSVWLSSPISKDIVSIVAYTTAVISSMNIQLKGTRDSRFRQLITSWFSSFVKEFLSFCKQLVIVKSLWAFQTQHSYFSFTLNNLTS